MKLDFSGERVLAVVAHPDDAELLCAGTLARAIAEGGEAAVCVMCRGDKGQPTTAIDNLAAQRRREMTSAAKLLGATLYQGKVSDSTLTDNPATRRKLTEFMRRFRATLVLAHWKEDYHPDHRAAGRLADAATWLAASRGQRTRGAPLKRPPALWWMDTIDMLNFEPTLSIDISSHLQLKHRMLACHASQLARSEDADFAPLEQLLERQATVRGAQAGVAAAEAFRPHFAFGRSRAW